MVMLFRSSIIGSTISTDCIIAYAMIDGWSFLSVMARKRCIEV